MATEMHTSARYKTAWGGVLLSVLGSLAWQDVWKTIILGAIGTAVSFCVSALLRRLFGKRKKTA
jgi:hypothetical protein